eukprot:5697071-Pyramimonas_sp.AAC.1
MASLGHEEVPRPRSKGRAENQSASCVRSVRYFSFLAVAVLVPIPPLRSEVAKCVPRPKGGC